MKVSYRWLASFFPEGAFDDMPPDELARRLTRQGLAVDDVRPAFAAFTGVVLGKVVQAGPHPNADRLTLCEVEAGDCGKAGVRQPFSTRSFRYQGGQTNAGRPRS